MDIRDRLRHYFGFDSFREGQEAVVSRVLEGRSVLAVFPTGAGKSLCFQLPALELEGLTLVVSPLIALMKDQIDFLQGRGLAAARLDSTLSREDVLRVFDDIRSGTLKLLYVSPERLNNERFLGRLAATRISMLVIDEAHCISEWGHNFRPDYLKIARLASSLKAERVMGLTATATPGVVADISKTFSIAADDVIHTGFYRPNLNLLMNPQPRDTRLATLQARLGEQPGGPTIIYVTLQKTAETVAAAIPGARAYHAGMPDDVRSAVQEWFMDSPTAIVVATIAFGMGIDKSDIRYVYHYNLPKSLENYMQEIGRAGRDGARSYCELLADDEDIRVLENFTYGDTPIDEALSGVLRELLDLGDTFDVSSYDLSFRYDLRPLVVSTLLTYLELDGILQTTQPFYSEYHFVPERSSADMLSSYPEDRQAFLKQIFRRAKKGRTWFALDLKALEEQDGLPRDRMVSALNHLEESGALRMKVAGLRLGYRRLRKIEGADMDKLADRLAGRFRARELADLERLQRVMELLRYAGCSGRYLLEYFGEKREDCGHCGHCMGHRVDWPAKSHTGPQINLRIIEELVAAQHDSLKHPRQVARYLCGITSPQTTRAKLTRTGSFAAFEDIRFLDVLTATERVMAKRT